MLIKSKKFIVSNTDPEKCPKPLYPEYAMVGRSNVGKSSLINMLLNSKGLAKISSTPGKSRLINHFLINEEWYLVDLPGYGFAKVSKKEREKWDTMLNDYMSSRENLQCVFQLIDSRIPPQLIDLQCVSWLCELEIPFVLVFTKTDKSKNRQVQANVKAFKDALVENGLPVPRMFLTSAQTGLGRHQLLNYVGDLNKGFSLGVR
jgi:GTP-binding protein